MYITVSRRYVARMSRTRAVIYLRQSKRKDDSISFEVQESAARQHAERRGYRVVDVVGDEGVSGFIDFAKRPGLARVLQMVETGDVDVVVVWRWSRLSRRRKDQAALLDRIESAGGRAESALEPVDTTTAGGRLSRGVFMEFAAFESDVKSEQWREAQARRVSLGLPKGGPVRFGYRRVEGSPVVAPDPVTGPLLRDAYLRYTAGAGFVTLVKELNARGVTSGRGGEWSATSLIRALDSGFGAGLLVEGKGAQRRFTKGAHEPVITEAEWDAYRRVRDRRRQEPPKRRTARWHLAGLIRCGVCGSPMVVSSYTAAKSQAVCSRYRTGGACTGSWVNRPALEHRLAIWLGGHLDELAAAAWTDTAREDERAHADAQVRALESDLTDLDAALARAATGYAKGLLDDDAYRLATAEVSDERTRTLAALAAAKDARDALLPLDADAAQRLTQATENMSPGEYNDLLKRVLRRVVVHADSITVEPVTGDAYTYAKPRAPRDPNAQRRDEAGRFA